LRDGGAYVSAIVRYWSISPAEPITPNVSVSGGSCGGTDVVGDEDVGAELGGLAEVAEEDPEESQAASTPVARTAAAASAVHRARPGPDLARTPKP
jgi:hypothetical protein